MLFPRSAASRPLMSPEHMNTIYMWLLCLKRCATKPAAQRFSAMIAPKIQLIILSLYYYYHYFNICFILLLFCLQHFCSWFVCLFLINNSSWLLFGSSWILNIEADKQISAITWSHYCCASLLYVLCCVHTHRHPAMHTKRPPATEHQRRIAILLCNREPTV